MNDFLEQKGKAKEKMLEAILEYAGVCHVENIANEMQASDELEEQVNLPSELDKKVKKLIAQYNRIEPFKKAWKTTIKIFPKFAVGFLAIFISFTILITSVQAFRVKVLNFFIEIGNAYTSIDLKEKKSNDSIKNFLGIPSDWENVYIPSYVPEGYIISKTNALITAKVIHYSNEKNELIVFTQYISENTNIRVDTENAKVSKVTIGSFNGIIAEKDGLISIEVPPI